MADKTLSVLGRIKVWYASVDWQANVVGPIVVGVFALLFAAMTIAAIGSP